MKNIKIALTERWYAWEDARWNAMADPSVDMYAEDGQNAYDESKDVAETEVCFSFLPLRRALLQVSDVPRTLSNTPSKFRKPTPNTSATCRFHPALTCPPGAEKRVCRSGSEHSTTHVQATVNIFKASELSPFRSLHCGETVQHCHVPGTP